MLIAVQLSAQTSYTWTGTTSTNWNTNTNWSPGGIPGATDHVTIVTGSNVCALAGNTTVTNVTMTSGTLNVGTYTFTSTGTANFRAGTVQGPTGNIVCTGNSVTFGNTTAGPTIYPSVTVTTLTVTMQRSTCHNSVAITKTATGISVDNWRGGNTFNGAFTLTNASADSTDPNGDIYLGSNASDPVDIFNGRTKFYLTGCARIRCPQNGSAIYNGVTEFYSQGYGTSHDRIQPARLGNSSVTFNDTVYFSCNSPTTDMYVAYDPNTVAHFYGPVVCTHQGSSAAAFLFASDGTVYFHNDVYLNNIGSGTINFGNGSGDCTLDATKKLYVGSTGFSSGAVNFYNFLQNGTTAQSLTLTGTATMRVGDVGKRSLFNGNVTFSSPSIEIDNSKFNGTATISKTGSNNNNWGGNNFTQAFSLTNSGSGNVYLSNTVAADTFASTTNFALTTSTGDIRASDIYNTTYPENITVSSTGTGKIAFGNNAGATTLAAGKIFSCGTYSSGGIVVKRFNQTGATTQNFTTTGTGYITFGGGNTASCNFNGDINVSCTGTFTSDSTFFYRALNCTTSVFSFFDNNVNITAGTTNFRVTGSSTSQINGYNLFNAALNFTHVGSSTIYMGNSSGGDTYNGTATITNSSNGTLEFSRTYLSTYKDIVLNNTGGGNIYFGTANGSSTMASGFTVTCGTVNSGNIEFRRFTQLGTTAQTLTTTGTANLRFGNGNNSSCYFYGDMTISNNATTTSDSTFFDRNFTSTGVNISYFDSRFNTSTGNTSITVNSATSSPTNGRNIFNGNFSLTNNGTASCSMANTSGDDTYNGNITLNVTNTGTINMSRIFNSAFNGNITLNCSAGTTTGITFGESGGISNQASTKYLNTGTFSAGQLIVYGYRQASGSQTNILNLTSTGILTFGTSTAGRKNTIGGDCNFSCASTANVDSSIFEKSFTGNFSSINTRRSSYNTVSGTTSITKYGTANDDNSGANTFNGSTTISITSASGRLRIGSTAGETFSNEVFLSQSSGGTLSPSYNAASYYSGSITVTSPSATAITFGSGASGVTYLNGSTAVTINKTGGTPNPSFTRLTIDKTGGDVTLNTRINIVNTFTPTAGILNTTQTNILNMNNASTTTIGTSTSYVNGPMNYDMLLNGTRTLNFPIGKSPDWRPSILSARHNNGVISYTYNAELFNASAQGLGWTLAPTTDKVSYVHYWDIKRYTTGTTSPEVPTTNLSGNQTITLYFDVNDVVTDGSMLTVCKNTYTSPAAWIDIGGTGAPAASGSNLTGSITSNSAPTAFNSFSRFTIGNKSGGANPLPIELTHFSGEKNKSAIDLKWITETEINNSHFELERSPNGRDFYRIATVQSLAPAGNSNYALVYLLRDDSPINDNNYYRLKQVDFDGVFTYSKTIQINLKEDCYLATVYPTLCDQSFSVKTGNCTEQINVSVISDKGKEIFSDENFKGETDVSTTNWSNGIYFVYLKSRDKVDVKKIIVQQ